MGGGNVIDVSLGASVSAAVAGVRNSFDVLCEIVTGRDESRVRQPFSLALCLDVSGSMSGSKLENAKHAVKLVLDAIGSEDQVHLVTFDSTAQIRFENGTSANRDALHRAVDALRAGTCTNLGGGLELARDVLLRSQCSNKRVFLFTDGIANRGKVGQPLYDMVHAMHEEGIVTTAYGIGADYEEETLSLIAEWGRGTFAYMAEPEHIPRYVKKGFKGLLKTIGASATLKLRGVNGAIVEKLYSGDDVIRGADLGDLHEDNRRQVLAAVTFAPTADNAGAEVIEWQLEYQDMESTACPKPFVTMSGRMVIAVTTDAAAAAADSESTWKVKVARQIADTAEADEALMEMLDRGDVDGAIATKEKSIRALEAVHDKDQTGFVSAILTRAKRTLGELAKREIARARKFTHHEAEMERALSASSLCYDPYQDE